MSTSGSPHNSGSTGSVRSSTSDTGACVLAFSGALTAHTVGPVWTKSLELVRAASVSAPLTIDMSEVVRLDGAGTGLLVELLVERRGLCMQPEGNVTVEGLTPEQSRLFDQFDIDELSRAKPVVRKPGIIESVGRNVADLLADLKEIVIFTGRCLEALVWAVFHPGKVRWVDALRAAENVGVHGLSIVLLIGFLMGLITGFQSAVPLQRFGAELFVSNLLAISLTRELSPLVTCILLAGRSGSAFAAEIGTMTVNEEVDALTTMGLDPVRFLAVPRILAALAVTPLLSVFFTLFALMGGAVVITSFGYPITTYLDKVIGSVTMGDMLGGLFKAGVFSLIVSGIGCQRGLATGTGASAVGDSTTSAVVSGLILISLVDGVFAVTFYALGW